MRVETTVGSDRRFRMGRQKSMKNNQTWPVCWTFEGMISLMAAKTSKLEMKFKRSRSQAKALPDKPEEQSTSLPEVTDDQVLPPQICLSDSRF